MSDLVWAWSLDKRDTLAAGLEAFRRRFGHEPEYIEVARPDALALDGIPIRAAAIHPATVAHFGLTCPVPKRDPGRAYQQAVLLDIAER